MDVTLNGKKAIVIGGSGTIGEEIVKRLLKIGCIVGASYYSHQYESELLRYKNDKKRLVLQHIDITDKVSVKKGIDLLVDQCDGVDIFIYNPGICADSQLPQMENEQWEHVINVNLTGAFYASKVISKYLIKNETGKMLFISSYKGITGSYGQSNYSASKAGLIGFTKSLARELGEYNIAANVICPGFIKTGLNNCSPYKERIAIQQSVLSRTSNTKELASFILYLLSDYVQNVSGQVFHVDSRV